MFSNKEEFNNLNNSLKSILGTLLFKIKEFEGFFDYVKWNRCLFLERDIKAYFSNKICDEVKLKDLIKKDIEAAKSQNVDMIVACMHWGDEYKTKANKEQEDLADFLFKNGVVEKDGINFNRHDNLRAILDSLPFKLTNAQNRAFNEILDDMASNKVMNRLVQGDVGSGKTVVALLSLANCVLNGYQGALMAPTEILAEQHYISLNETLSQFGMNISYKIQPSPDGLAQAFTIGKEFIGDDECAMALGDNIYYGNNFKQMLLNARKEAENGKASIFGYKVHDPERFGIVEFDSTGKVLSVEQKPKKP
mgnify:CR=1 FL=1